MIADAYEDLDALWYLLEYDSTYGRLRRQDSASSRWQIGSETVLPVCARAIEDVAWGKEDIDVVVDASGSEPAGGAYESLVESGVQIVLVTNGKGPITNALDDALHAQPSLSGRCGVYWAGTCDGAALGPILQVVDLHWGIRGGFVTTLHPWLAHQRLLDDPPQIGEELLLGRSATRSIMPRATSAGEMAGRQAGLSHPLVGLSFRVPTACVTAAEVIVRLDRPATAASINDLVQRNSEANAGAIGYSEEAVVSIDLLGDERTGVLDGRWTTVVGDLARIIVWYDNEMGYAHHVMRLVDAQTQEREG